MREGGRVAKKNLAPPPPAKRVEKLSTRKAATGQRRTFQ